MNLIDDEDMDLCQFDDDTKKEQQPTCPRCIAGCGYCLMLER